MTSLTKSPKNGTVKPPTLEKVDTEVPPHDESGALSAEEREVIDVVRCMVSVGFKASDAIGRLALSPKSEDEARLIHLFRASGLSVQEATERLEQAPEPEADNEAETSNKPDWHYETCIYPDKPGARRPTKTFYGTADGKNFEIHTGRGLTIDDVIEREKLSNPPNEERDGEDIAPMDFVYFDDDLVVAILRLNCYGDGSHDVLRLDDGWISHANDPRLYEGDEAEAEAKAEAAPAPEPDQTTPKSSDSPSAQRAHDGLIRGELRILAQAWLELTPHWQEADAAYGASTTDSDSSQELLESYRRANNLRIDLHDRISHLVFDNWYPNGLEANELAWEGCGLLSGGSPNYLAWIEPGKDGDSEWSHALEDASLTVFTLDAVEVPGGKIRCTYDPEGDQPKPTPTQTQTQAQAKSIDDLHAMCSELFGAICEFEDIENDMSRPHTMTQTSVDSLQGGMDSAVSSMCLVGRQIVNRVCDLAGKPRRFVGAVPGSTEDVD